MMTLVKKCPMCGVDTTITVPRQQYANWRSGMLIQDAMPELDADTRETLISGFCASCQDKLFGGDEE